MEVAPSSAVATLETAIQPLKELKKELTRLKQRCTKTTGKVWALVLAVAKKSASAPCTLQELATFMRVPEKSVLSYRRILGRSCHPKRLNLNVINRYEDKYTMPDNVRKIVLELG